MPRVRVPIAIVQIPPAGPAAPAPGGECGVNGPYLRWCGAGFPTADYKGIIVVIEGVADDSVVEWSTSISAENAFFRGDVDKRAAIMQVIDFGLIGTVTATVDGTPYELAINLTETSCNPT